MPKFRDSVEAVKSGFPFYTIIRSPDGSKMTCFSDCKTEQKKLIEECQCAGFEVISSGQYQVAKNFMTDLEFVEDTKTNYYISPRSETYWST